MEPKKRVSMFFGNETVAEIQKFRLICVSKILSIKTGLLTRIPGIIIKMLN